MDASGNRMANCKIASTEGSIDFTFANGPAVISVPSSQIIRPSDDNDDYDDDNSDEEMGGACLFGSDCLLASI